MVDFSKACLDPLKKIQRAKIKYITLTLFL